MLQADLDKIVSKTASSRNIHGAVFHISSEDGDIDLISAAGNIECDSPYFIASINKLIISSLILRLHEQGELNLSDRISDYVSLPIDKILVYKGRDYSSQITIRHLLSHTSGLPCYLLDKKLDGTKSMKQILNGDDQAWPLEKVLSTMRGIKAKFPPGKSGKAHYSETNFRLLDNILVSVFGEPLPIILKDLFSELGMDHTHLLPNPKKETIPVFYKKNKISIDNYWSSSKHDIASTARDQMRFLQAFFSGYFYPKDKLKELEDWNRIFFPFKYGIGIQKFYIPRILSPFRAVPDIIGHGGSVGSVAFYVPEKKLFITGTVNQPAKPNAAFQTMMKIINKL